MLIKLSIVYFTIIVTYAINQNPLGAFTAPFFVIIDYINKLLYNTNSCERGNSMKSYKREFNYIMDNYLNKVKFVTPLFRDDEKNIYSGEALIGDNPYEVYRSDLGEVVIAPKKEDFFEGDFNDVYGISRIDGKYINFFIIRKQKGIIEKYYYSYLKDNTLYPNSLYEVSLKYSSVEDFDNNLKELFTKSKISKEFFLLRNSVCELKNEKKECIITIRKTKKKKIEQCVYNSLFENIKDIVNNETKFQEIEVDENESFINLTNNILNENKKVKKKKRK